MTSSCVRSADATRSVDFSLLGDALGLSGDFALEGVVAAGLARFPRFDLPPRRLLVAELASSLERRARALASADPALRSVPVFGVLGAVALGFIIRRRVP